MLPKPNRLNQEADIVRILRKGSSVATPFFTFKFLPSSLTRSRFGFLVSKKVSNKANKRNLAKRRLRAAVLRYLPQIQFRCDSLFIARPPILNKSYKEIEPQVLYTLKKASQALKKT